MASGAVFATARLRLRPPRLADVAILATLWTDERVRLYLGGTLELSLAVDRARNLLQAEHCFVLQHNENNLVLGYVTLDASRPEGTEISYQLLPEFWGQGYGREAVAAVLAFAFKDLCLQQVIAVTQTANVRSCRLLDAVGMSPMKQFEEFGASQTMYVIRSHWS